MFGEVLGCPVYTTETLPSDVTRIDPESSMRKDVLRRCYDVTDPLLYGSTKHLRTRYRLANEMFRVTIAPKVGDRGELRGTVVQLLYLMDLGTKIDVMDFIFEELRTAVYDKKSCIYGPYLQLLFDRVCGPAITSRYPLTEHIQFRPHLVPKVTKRGSSSRPADTSAPSSSRRAPSRKKGNAVVRALRALFCMSKDQTVRLKRIERRLKDEKRARGLVTPEGSECDETNYQQYEFPTDAELYQASPSRFFAADDDDPAGMDVDDDDDDA